MIRNDKKYRIFCIKILIKKEQSEYKKEINNIKIIKFRREWKVAKKSNGYGNDDAGGRLPDERMRCKG